MAQVISFGILVADIIGLPIDTYPAPGALQLVSRITPHIGGCAANTGIALQTLGLETLVTGQVGRDGLGEFVRHELQHAGVQVRIGQSESAPTSATIVLVASSGERSFLHSTGANATLQSSDFDLNWLQGAQLLHIAGHGLMPLFDGASCAELLQKVRKLGLHTSLDTAGAPNARWNDNLCACLPYLDFFVPSLHEVERLFPGVDTPETIATRLLSYGVGCVALKMGERGCYVSNGHTSHHVPPYTVEAIDSTGAGDAFAAGFLAGVLHGFDLRRCAELGNACGALCVTRVGTIAGLRSLSTTLEFMQDGVLPD